MSPSCDNFPLASISYVRGRSFHTVVQWIRIQAAAEVRIHSCLYDITYSFSWIKHIIWHRKRPEQFYLHFTVIFHLGECVIKSSFLAVREKLKRKKKKKSKEYNKDRKTTQKLWRPGLAPRRGLGMKTKSSEDFFIPARVTVQTPSSIWGWQQPSWLSTPLA